MSKSVANQSTSEQTTLNQTESSNAAIAQFNKLRQTLFTRESALTLGQSLRLTITILKELSLLFWLSLCYTLVAFSWLGDRAVQSGQQTKSWWLELKQRRSNQRATDLAAEAGKSVVDGSKAAISYAVEQAKKQVGLLDKE